MKGQSGISQLLFPYSTQSPRLNGCSQHIQILAHFLKRGGRRYQNRDCSIKINIFRNFSSEKLGSFL